MGDHTSPKKTAKVDKVMQFLIELDTKTDSNIGALQGQVTSLQTQVTSLQDALLSSQHSHAELTTTLQSYKQQQEISQLEITDLRAIITAFRAACPEDATTIANAVDDVAGLRDQVVTFAADMQAMADLREKLDAMDANLRNIKQAEDTTVEQLVTFKAALLKTTTAQEAQEQRVQQLSRQTRQERAQLVVRAPQGTTCTQVSAALGKCLPCELSDIQVRLATKPAPPPPTRDPRLQQPAAAPGAASAPTATTTPPMRLVFVVSLLTMQMVDGALKGQQCRELLEAGGYDFKLDDYLTREQMQQRMRMRPTQRRLQEAGVVAAYRGVELWQLTAPEGAAPGAKKTWSKVDVMDAASTG